MGKLSALNHVFAISDRKDEHFIWDLDEKTLFSIDHEVPAVNDIDPIVYLQQMASRRLGPQWFDDHQYRSAFTEGFISVWQSLDDKKSKILEKYQTYNLQSYTGVFMQRLTKGPQWVLQQIMI